MAGQAVVVVAPSAGFGESKGPIAAGRDARVGIEAGVNIMRRMVVRSRFDNTGTVINKFDGVAVFNR